MSNLVNLLTLFRLISGPLILILIISLHSYGLALVIYVFASATDFLDGYLARKYNCVTVFGEVLDPIADKILSMFLILSLALYFESFYITLLGGVILSREFWVSALRDLNARRGNLHATKVSLLSKFKTMTQFLAFTAYLVGIYYNNSLIIFVSDLVLLLATIITIHTGFLYTIESFKYDQSLES